VVDGDPLRCGTVEPGGIVAWGSGWVVVGDCGPGSDVEEDEGFVVVVVDDPCGLPIVVEVVVDADPLWLW